MAVMGRVTARQVDVRRMTDLGTSRRSRTSRRTAYVGRIQPSDDLPLQCRLDGVDKFEPVSGDRERHHAEEPVGKLVIVYAGHIGLEMGEHALNAVALFVERPVISIFTLRFDPQGMTASIFVRQGKCR